MPSPPRGSVTTESAHGRAASCILHTAQEHATPSSAVIAEPGTRRPLIEIYARVSPSAKKRKYKQYIPLSVMQIFVLSSSESHSGGGVETRRAEVYAESSGKIRAHAPREFLKAYNRISSEHKVFYLIRRRGYM